MPKALNIEETPNIEESVYHKRTVNTKETVNIEETVYTKRKCKQQRSYKF